MPCFVAFLRGINVGGHRVRMDRLQAEFEALGFTGVVPFIASGNVVFTATSRVEASLCRRIEEHLAACLGYAVPTLLRTPAALRAVAAHEPFPTEETEREGHSVQVMFLSEEPSPGVKRSIEALVTARDAFRVHGREVYWLSRGRLTDSLVPTKVIDKALSGLTVTQRNRTTLRKLVARLPE